MHFAHALRAFLLLSSLFYCVCYVPGARSAIDVKHFFAQKFNFGPPFSVGFTYFTDFPGPALNEPGAALLWQTRAGTWAPGDIDDGLYLNPASRGTPFFLAGRTSLAQIIELETAIFGGAAIDATPNTTFDVAASYENIPYAADGFIAGIALSNLLHQPTNPDQRAFGIAVARLGGEHYVLSKDFLTGDVIEQQPITFDYPTIDLFISREDPSSSRVRFGYRYRDDDGAIVTQFPLGLAHAFSDVVLRPAIFAAAPIIEPRTWTLLLAALGVIAVKVASGRRPSRLRLGT